MAMNWDKYTKPVERRKPIIFLVNASATNPSSIWSGEKCCCERSAVASVISYLINDFIKNNIRADVSIIAFGNEVNLVLPYTDVINCESAFGLLKEYPVSKGAAVFGTGLLAVKEMLEDFDETPQNIYKPTVILVTTNEPSMGWESCLEEFKSDGRSAKSQRLAIYISKDRSAEGVFEEERSNMDRIESKAVKEFASRTVGVYLSDYVGASWTKDITSVLSFEIMDEEQAIVEIEKVESDIQILENSKFDGNGIDKDSFI